jgi:hypothetical protein
MIELIIVVLLMGNGPTRATVLPPQEFKTEAECKAARAEQMKEFVGKNVIMKCQWK